MLSVDDMAHQNTHAIPNRAATLRLAPILPTKVAFAQFPDVQHAVDAVQEILMSPYGSHIRMPRYLCRGYLLLTLMFYRMCGTGG